MQLVSPKVQLNGVSFCRLEAHSVQFLWGDVQLIAFRGNVFLHMTPALQLAVPVSK